MLMNPSVAMFTQQTVVCTLFSHSTHTHTHTHTHTAANPCIIASKPTGVECTLHAYSNYVEQGLLQCWTETLLSRYAYIQVVSKTFFASELLQLLYDMVTTNYYTLVVNLYTMTLLLAAQQQESEAVVDDSSLGGWDTRAAMAAGGMSFQKAPPTSGSSKQAPSYPQTLIAGPSLLPTPPHGSAPEGFHVIPGVQMGMGGQPADWAQLQVQMQILSQHNPAFFAQMQQFFWSQNMAQLQMQAAAAAQGYHHHLQQQPPAAPTGAPAGGQPPAGGQDFQNFGGSGAEYGGGGAGGAQYVAAGGGLFIPPMAHIPPPPPPPHLVEETDAEPQSQGQRRSLAIPIVPPKVCHRHCIHTRRYSRTCPIIVVCNLEFPPMFVYDIDSKLNVGV